ncbi:uncharacterized protein [Macrobrachium rosenbergii]|uniref:uncharacterized protein isoform X2 n=1 Tax=Macrobrachium rosenbergii TaxID=79674 RepID=UPI0034D60CC7
MAPKEGLTTPVCVSLVFLLVLQGAAVAAVCSPVKDVLVPPYPHRHSNVTLECPYDVGDSELYKVTWFLDDMEIYRYVPSQAPEVLIIPNDRVEVLESGINPETIVLKEVDLSAGGVYKCETMLEWPDFRSDVKSRSMAVVVIPDEPPRIVGDVVALYAAGNTVNLTCIAAPSIPVTTVVWLMNDKECTATIAAMYRRSHEHIQQKPTAFATDVRECPTKGSQVMTGSASQHVLGLSLLAALVLASLVVGF